MEQVSVIIPCYKQAHFLGEAIESVRAQTYRHYEMIVIDDGSPDHPEEVVKRYPEVRYIRQDNQGVSKARNRGLQESTGRYVVFLDADDRLLPNHFQTGLTAFHENPDVACVHGAYTWWTSERRLHVHNCEYGLDPYGALLIHSIALGATLWRRDIVMKLGGFREFKRAQDHDLQLRVAQTHPIYCHHELIAEYRDYDKPLDWAVNLEETMRMHRSQHRYIKTHPKRSQYEHLYQQAIRYPRERFGDKLLWEIGVAARAGEVAKCLRYFWVLLRFYPKGLTNHLQGLVTRRLSMREDRKSM